MPAKYAPSVKKYDRQTGKSWEEHYYIKTLSDVYGRDFGFDNGAEKATI